MTDVDTHGAAAHDPEDMPSNPKESEWYATPNAKRKRKYVGLTLAPEELALLDDIAAAHDDEHRSRVVAAAVVAFARMPPAERARVLIACAADEIPARAKR